MPDIFINPDEKPREPEKIKAPEVKKEVKELLGETFVKPQTKNVLSSYLTHPKNIDFEIKDKEEKVELLLRQHPIVNIKWMLISVLMVLAPIILVNFLSLSFLPVGFRLVAFLIWYLITMAFSLENFLSWYFNVYIITDERVIDIDFLNLIYKEVSDANIDKIQDITYKMGGVARTMFNYGDVFIQTAGEIPNFEFAAVPKPDRVVKILEELRMEEQQEALEGRIR